ncbi:MAG: peptidoglycan editing factor PgeF [Chromatocurvus sp.]
MPVERVAAGFPCNITALTTTRGGGVSRGPWQSFNLASHVGDDAYAVATNRDTLQSSLPAGVRIAWLEQVHGTKVVDAARDHGGPADASVCRQPGVACAILTADCLPVLLCDRAGSVVAAAHAGWRGLADGVIEATATAMSTAPADVMAWLGPCIGPAAFEVGPEVRAAFCDRAPAATVSAVSACFRPSVRPGHFIADLRALARQRLTAMGVDHIAVDSRCTRSAPEAFFSYRRDGETGRMASLILVNA